MPRVTHHDACECRMEIVRELADALSDALVYLPGPGMDDIQLRAFLRGLAALEHAVRAGFIG